MLETHISTNRKELFLRACRSEPVERVPVWMMRQAGRYLPDYRAVRQKHAFLEVCKTPELAVEVSLQPFRTVGVDAVIVFSDILIPAEAMGVEVELTDSGPVITHPIREVSQVEALRVFDPEQDTGFVAEAIRRLCRELGPEVPVLGFAGAPWTLAGYLKAQIAAGAAAVQVFDTWAGELSRRDYQEFALPATQLLIAELSPGAVPVILYTKASDHLLRDVGQVGASVLSVDWRVDLAELRQRLGGRIALQGNVDPCVLLGPAEGIRRAVREAIEKTGGVGHILNLGHGILPSTPVENARAFVQTGQTTALPARAPLGRAD